MKKLLIIDRDGTLILEPEDYQIDSFEKLSFYPGAISWLSRIAKESDFELIMLTNQDGLGTESFPEETFWPVQQLIIRTLKGEGIRFREVLIDRTFASEKAATRKPQTGLLTKYLEGDYDLANSYVIGDRITDVELAANLGASAIWLNSETGLGAEESSLREEQLKQTLALETEDWADIYRLLLLPQRKSHVLRETKETRVEVFLDLDGKGRSNISTGIHFFDHMLHQIAAHSGIDLELETKGDLQVDEHHTIEDTALALGEAFRKALGDKAGMERYGFFLPMDEAQAKVGIDFGGRPWLRWKAKFKRERVGELPTEMVSHFFKSFTDEARCTLHISVKGDNDHHKIEVIFKAFARAIRQALRREAGNTTIPSTKGSI